MYMYTRLGSAENTYKVFNHLTISLNEHSREPVLVREKINWVDDVEFDFINTFTKPNNKPNIYSFNSVDIAYIIKFYFSRLKGASLSGQYYSNRSLSLVTLFTS